jgi:DNA-binding transcriptional ArsR family regulator
VAYGSTSLVALAEPIRTAIVEHLGRRPMSVGELARQLPVTRPAVSQHLKVLKTAGLVRDQAAGTRRIYSIDPQGLGAIRAWLDQFWDNALTEYAKVAEEEEIE